MGQAVSTKLTSACLCSHPADETLAQPVSSPGAAFAHSHVQLTLRHPDFSYWGPLMEKRESQHSFDFPETPGNEGIIPWNALPCSCPSRPPHSAHTPDLAWVVPPSASEHAVLSTRTTTTWPSR